MITTDTVRKYTRLISNLRVRLALLISLLAFNWAVAQNTTSISGRVISSDSGEGAVGASVYIEGSSVGTVTDFDGNYSFETTESGEIVLVISYVGYQTLKTNVSVSGSPLNVTVELQPDFVGLDVVVVTGNANPKAAMESSISVSSIQADQIDQSAPRSTAEIFKNIPGIKSESTGGDGNANITVRGIPIATGGAKFLQIHEDGLPVMQFGDISFGNADIFVRADRTVARIEALRGGSASILASNSPAGVINFISKTGKEKGGSIGTTVGLDYNSFRTDLEYGDKLKGGWNYHIGGFYRQGEGPREAGYNGNQGGQIKANLTKEFEKGFARVYFKYLNDRAIGYLPLPVEVSGTNADPEISSITGLNAKSGTVHSKYLTKHLSVDQNGNTRTSNVKDGMHPEVIAVGGEFGFSLGDNFYVSNKARQEFVGGGFVTPFPAAVGDAQAMAESIGGAGATLSYANGPMAGQTISNPSALNGNGVLMNLVLFDTQFDDLNSFSDDLQFTAEFDGLKLTGGFYKAVQTIGMSWLWNNYLMEVKSDNAALIDVTNAGTSYTENGLIAYGAPVWGNCCTRSYNVDYNINAPYLNAEFSFGNLTMDGGVRFDFGNAKGYYKSSHQLSMDVNNDGEISFVEQSVSVVSDTTSMPVDYNWNYLSLSFGANYKITNNQAVFGRYSRGGRANADRLLYGTGIAADGSAVGGLNSDMVGQAEAGYKFRTSNLGFFVTAFLSNVEEQNYEATTQKFVNRKYRAYGLELEAAAQISKLSLRGSITLTDAEIVKDKVNPDMEGNRPRRQAVAIFNATPSYDFGRGTVGLNIIGTTDSYAQDNNELVLPGYTQVNAFVNVDLYKGLSMSVNANNLFNAFGLTEAEEGTITEGTTNIIRARAINGRTTSVSLFYKF